MTSPGSSRSKSSSSRTIRAVALVDPRRDAEALAAPRSVRPARRGGGSTCSAYQRSAARCSAAARGNPRRSSRTGRPGHHRCRHRPSAGGSFAASLLPLLASPGSGDGGVGAFVRDVVRVAEHLEHLVEGEVEDVLGPVQAEADADVEPEPAQARDGYPDGDGLVALPQREHPLGPGQSAAGERAVAERGDEPASARVRVASCRAATSAPPVGAWAASLSWRSSHSGRSTTVGAADLVAHGPLPPQLLVPLQRGGHGGGDLREVGQRAAVPASAGIAPSGTHERRRWRAARRPGPSPSPRAR